jgi:hypothetical protein
MTAPLRNPAQVKQTAQRIRAELEKAQADATARYRQGTSEWFSLHRALVARIAQALESDLSARITDRFDGARARIHGISATSTMGVAAALQNWCVSVEKRLQVAA